MQNFSLDMKFNKVLTQRDGAMQRHDEYSRRQYFTSGWKIRGKADHIAPSHFKEQYKSGLNTTLSENVAHSLRQWLKLRCDHTGSPGDCFLTICAPLFLAHSLSLLIIRDVHLIILSPWRRRNSTRRHLDRADHLIQVEAIMNNSVDARTGKSLRELVLGAPSISSQPLLWSFQAKPRRPSHLKLYSTDPREHRLS